MTSQLLWALSILPLLASSFSFAVEGPCPVNALAAQYNCQIESVAKATRQEKEVLMANWKETSACLDASAPLYLQITLVSAMFRLDADAVWVATQASRNDLAIGLNKSANMDAEQAKAAAQDARSAYDLVTKDCTKP